ncbi:hypothetical protein BC834DRAFT_787786, partial [Gloeopeniophorella convolvens]
DHPDYSQVIARWAANTERRASIVALVRDADDVSLALQYARINSLSVAIRGGVCNHAGSSSVEGGLVVDLSRYLDYTFVDAEVRTARIGGGAIWSTVDKAAIKHGLAAVAGNLTFPYSFLLGGGLGYLSGQHGLAIDNLIQVSVVTASGNLLTASKDENPELFWGIHGGSSN